MKPHGSDLGAELILFHIRKLLNFTCRCGIIEKKNVEFAIVLNLPSSWARSKYSILKHNFQYTPAMPCASCWRICKAQSISIALTGKARCLAVKSGLSEHLLGCWRSHLNSLHTHSRLAKQKCPLKSKPNFEFYSSTVYFRYVRL